MGVRSNSSHAALNAVVAFLAFLATSCTQSSSDGAVARAAPALPVVSIVTIGSADAPLTYEFSAQVIPYRRVEVRARMEGIIRERSFVEGELVRAGQVLYQLERPRYEAAFHAAEARVDAARQRSERYTLLIAQHAVATQDVDDARTELEVAQAQLAQTRRDFDDTFVRAEMDGRVGRTMLDVGARVSGPNDLLTTIDRLDPVYVSFRPSSEQVLEWSKDAVSRKLVEPRSGLIVEAQLPDGSTLPRTGHLDFVAPSLDASAGTQEFRAVFANPDRMLVPGQYVRARLIGLKAKGALSIPVRAVQTTLGRQFVYVVASGDTIRSRDVDLGAWSADRWIIRSGLRAGDRVVVDGMQKVAPGRPARPVSLADTTNPQQRRGL